MQTIECNIGVWKVRARLEEVDDSKLMAIVSAMVERGGCSMESRHLLVFDHMPGYDRVEETKDAMQRVLSMAH